MVWLKEEKRVTHHDAVAVYDGVEPVSDGEHCAISELVPDRPLDQLVCPMAGNSNLRLEEQHRARNQGGATAAPPLVKHTLLQVQTPSVAGTWGLRWPWPHR